MNRVIILTQDFSNITDVASIDHQSRIMATMSAFTGDEGRVYLQEFKATGFVFMYVTEPETTLLDPLLPDNIIDNAVNIMTEIGCDGLPFYTIFQETNRFDRLIGVYFVSREATNETFRSFVDEYFLDDGMDDDVDVFEYVPPYKVAGQYLH